MQRFESQFCEYMSNKEMNDTFKSSNTRFAVLQKKMANLHYEQHVVKSAGKSMC